MMDYFQNFNLIFFLVSVCCLVNLSLVESQSGILEPRVFTTRYGSVMGMVIQNEGLRPVEVFSGLQYASTRQNMLRFIPPSSSLEKWLGVRVFSSKTYRGVCPQQFRRVKQIKSKRPKQYLEHLRKVESHIVYQAEECLMMNLYVPRKGKINSL